jgi:hypothetical protein
MPEGDTGEAVDSGIATTETEPELGTLAGIVTDGIIGAVGGFAGTALMTVVFLVASTLGGFQLTSFATTAELIGAGAVFGPDLLVPIGYVIFLGGGMTTWPLLFASLGEYLPGEKYAHKGVFYGFVLWTGFVLAFYTGYTGFALGVYLVATLLGHLGYGFALGAIFDYLGSREETLV